MTTFKDAFLPALDVIRGVPGLLGLRNTSVTVRVVTWTGNKPGAGSVSFVDTPIKVGGGLYNPRVTQVTERDAIASEGMYSNQDIKVGPFTPPFLATFFIAAGGVSHDVINPSQTSPVGTGVKEIFFALDGEGFQGKKWFQRVGDEAIPATRRYLYLKRSGVQQPGGAP